MTEKISNNNEKDTIVISELLAVLLKFSKTEFLKDCQPSEEITKLKSTLGPLYSFDMKAMDVARVVLNAYQEMIAEPRFEVTRHDVTFNLMFAPIERTRRLTMFTEKAFDFDNVEIKMIDVCYSYVYHMLSEMMLSNVGWCKHVIFEPLEARSHVSS